MIIFNFSLSSSRSQKELWGRFLHLQLGLLVNGDAVGASLGPALGDAVGASLGPALGDAVGASLGRALGDAVGLTLGTALGDAVGLTLGPALGDAVGLTLGTALGAVELDVWVRRQSSMSTDLHYLTFNFLLREFCRRRLTEIAFEREVENIDNA